MGSVRYLRAKKSSKYLKITVAVGIVVALTLLLTWRMKLIKHEIILLDETRLELVNATLTALERALEYLHTVGDSVHFDAVFAVRVVEAQLAAFLRYVVRPYQYRNKNDRLKSLTERVYDLKEKAGFFRQKYTNSIKRNQPEYYAGMKFMLHDGNWELWYPQRDINRAAMPTYGFEKLFVESIVGPKTDSCFKEPYAKQCHFTKECWDLMAHDMYYGFSLTHEILFILNSIALSCDKEVDIASNKWKKMSADQLVTMQCAAVLHEAELIADKNYPPYHWDLFAEQVFVCGILGYRDFFRDEWVQKIISWQNENGCYLLDYNATVKVYHRDKLSFTTTISKRSVNYDFLHNDSKLHSGATTPNESPSGPTGYHRQKRSEYILPDGCWLHLTGVAMGALGQYIRFLLEPLMQV